MHSEKQWYEKKIKGTVKILESENVKQMSSLFHLSEFSVFNYESQANNFMWFDLYLNYVRNQLFVF